MFPTIRPPIIALLAVLGLGVVACAPAPPPLKYPEVNFRAAPPLRIDAAVVEVVEAYVPPLRAPHVEQDAPVAPSTLLRRWAEQRLEATGDRGRVLATIRDARIVETVLATNQTVEGSFTTEQAARFEGRVAMTVELLDAAGGARASVEGEAKRTRTLPENATLREREEVLFQMSEDLANDLDKVLEANIRQHFAPHLRP